MGLVLEGRIAAGNDLLDADLRDIQIITRAGATFLYAATGQNGGISVYQLNPSGALAGLRDTSYFSTTGITMGRFDMVTLDGAERLILNGTGNRTLVTYGIENDGSLGGLSQIGLPAHTAKSSAGLTGLDLGNGKSALYLVDGATGTLDAYVSNGSGGINASAPLSGPAAAYRLGHVVELATVQAGGNTFLLAADGDAGVVRSYRVDVSSGALAYSDALGAPDGLGIAAPTAMEVVKTGGTAWVILAAAGSGSLSVMRLGGDGALAPVDHILDTLATRFGGVTALEVVKVDGHVLVLAGGADDGLALFSLLPDGQLVHMQSLAQDYGLGLENITDIEAVEIGGEIQIFVTSGAGTGISQFSLSLADLGSVIQSPGASGGQVLGTGAGDLILGAGAQDRLMGQGGDDILVSAPGGGVLTGGNGADIFVLCPTDGTLEISDFRPGVDRLDLSRFPNLRSMAQIAFTPTGDGITLGIGTTTIRIKSFDGNGLKAIDLWPAGFDTPDRVELPSGPVIRVTNGSGGDDTLVLGTGQDHVRGFGGNDLIRGGIGKDRLFGGDGNDTLVGGKGRDLLKGGKGDDRLMGGAGDDTLKGGKGKDTLRGEAGKDTLRGGGGQDTLKGGAGDDMGFGGKGDDTGFGGAGDDILKGARGRDTLKGGTGKDILKGGRHDDTLAGENGRDTLKGQGGRDVLNGGDKADMLFGGKGADKLIGGRGNDVMAGGAGADVFIFGSGGGKGHGDDLIRDFTPGQDLIRIDIKGVDFTALTLTRQGSDTLIDTGAGSITLENTLPRHLDSDDFLFS